jgi:hypothetical protein
MDFLAGSPLTLNLSVPVTAAGTTTTLSTTNAINVSIKGKAYSHAALTNAATPTTDANTGAAFPAIPANFGAAILIGINAAGSLGAVQGGLQALDVNGNFIVSPQFPELPDSYCPFAYEVIKAGSTASSSPGWVFGSSNQSGVTGITYALQDICTIPSRPQVS